MVRKLGAKRWKLLHRLAYAVAILGVVHFYLLVKSDVRLPLTFAAVLTPLLGFRLGSHYWSLVAASRKPKPARMASIAQRPPKYWKGQLRVASTIPETHNVKTFRLQSPDGADLPFRFEAGQYINLRLPINGQFVSRSYTISSAPTQSAYCEITVKREEQGTGSRYLHDQVREGAILEVGAPAGRFTFDHRAHHSVTLIAGGVGITPMMSIARSLIDRSWAGKIYFIFVARTPADLIFHDELRLRDKQFRNLNLLITLTSPPTDHWPGQSGRLNAQVLQSFVPDLATHPVFVCGPAAMMEATCELLKQMGVPDHLIRTEEFVSPPASQVESNGQATPDNSYGPEANGGQGDRPDDLNQSIIHFVTSRVVATADPQTNLLEVAESAGVDLPWECRAGICGQCKIKCLEGKVSMASHLALSESEKTSGYILACQALPVSSEIRVQA
jgi:ferredoxin-NADP reductase